MQNARLNSRFLVGHTRYSTRGTVCAKNSHPFEYGDVVGAHNGIVDAPNSYSVDSEYLIDLLNQNESDYQTALSDAWGYWTLSWYDKRDEYLYLTMFDNSCGLVSYEGMWIFSSDADHIATAIGATEVIKFGNGQTVRFDKEGRMENLNKFEAVYTTSYKRDKRTTGGKQKTYGGSSTYYGNGYYGNTSYTSGSTTSKDDDKWDDPESVINVNDPESFIRDFDEEFRQVWEDYAHHYEAI